MDAVTTSSPPRKRVALVIGSGSVKCAAALGMWKVLQREGIGIDMVVGCSGGSLYAAVMALGHDIDTCERLTRELWTPGLTTRRDLRSLLGAVLPRVFGFDGSFGMVSDKPLMTALDHLFGARRFDETSIPLHIVATDLANGQMVALSEGSVRDAVRASIAIPYIWKPWKVGDRWLLDGCASDPLPIDVAIREGADVILAMGFESPYPSRIRSATRYAFQVNSIYTNNLLRANYAFHNLAHHAEIIPVLPDFDRPVRLFDTHEIPYVIEEGERATDAQLGYLRQALEAAHA
ncbi:patatin-like phospholipase family protein [Luteimonas suaedae]|uniref:patatin-like phospholipase family protein n=1 Tax=Luteimonas suaedae TaxID=2605430 RepID=UPI0011F05112|nr:patatin-like phospholipase family protein [Luteimonas suaedae]